MWMLFILQSMSLISFTTSCMGLHCDDLYLYLNYNHDYNYRPFYRTLPSAIKKPTTKTASQPPTKPNTQSANQSTPQPPFQTTASTSNQSIIQSTTQPPSQQPFLHDNNIENITLAMGIFGFLAVLFNSFVIFRVVHNAMKAHKIHKSKYLFLSLAFADVYFGVFCSLYTLIGFKVINIEYTSENLLIEKIWRETSTHLSLNASLYHILMITLDRYLATALPLFHKVHVTRCKISIVIIISWLLAISLAVLPLCTNSNLVSEWFYIIIGCCGLFLLIVTYTHIIIVIFKRWCRMKKQHKKKNVSMSEKSISTTIFSIIITLIYLSCIAITFLHQTNFVQEIFIRFLLYSINAAVNPIFYSIVDYIRRLVERKRKKKSLECQPLQKM